MPANPSPSRDDFGPALQQVAELREWSGAPKEFWPRLMACLGALTGARKVSLLAREAVEPPQWKTLTEWSSQTGPASLQGGSPAHLGEVATRCLTESRQFFPHERMAAEGVGQCALAVRLKLYRSEEAYIIACLLPEVRESTAREALLRLNLAADVPYSYHTFQIAKQAKADVEKFAVTLDLMVQVNAEKRFLAAALAFCNALATRFNCDRVTLGWLEGGYVKLRAISRTEQFQRQMVAAQLLEAAMEETLDQDEEILWPTPEGATFVARDHERFAKDQNVGNLCSLPLRVDNKPVAALTCERQATPFSQTEVQQFRLCCDQAIRRLADLKHHDRWFGARWTAAAKDQCARLVGPQHTWAKILGLTIAALLAVLFFVKVDYRVEGNFVLRSDEVAYLTAPFDGFIREVHVRTGDTADEGGRLLSLDTAELLLEQSAALADLNRYQREAEKARAAKALAEMRIAEAMGEQAKARLDLVRYRLQQATLKAPFVGAVVEGDLRERIGAPVKQGDPLFKFARTDHLYVEAEVHERDVHEILDKKTGEIAFVSQPKNKYRINVLTVEPASVPKEGGNMFLLRCEVEGGTRPWWRPGMSGLCKLNVEKRTLFWIITHRTVDFLRMFLWW